MVPSPSSSSAFQRTVSRELRQYELLIQINGRHLLQSVPPWQQYLRMMMNVLQEKIDHPTLRQTGGVHGDASPSSYWAH